MKNILLTATLAATLALTGCGLFGKKDSSRPTGAGPNDVIGYDGTSGAPQTNLGAPVEVGGNTGGRFDAAAAGLSGTIVYFEFDSYALNADGQRLAAEFGKYLSANPAARLRLEGHADERGTREYNIGLGERRARAVQDALVENGASAAQLSLLSYGEERPVNPAHSEEAWAQNRRVEIVKQ